MDRPGQPRAHHRHRVDAPRPRRRPSTRSPRPAAREERHRDGATRSGSTLAARQPARRCSPSSAPSPGSALAQLRVARRRRLRRRELDARSAPARSATCSRSGSSTRGSTSRTCAAPSAVRATSTRPSPRVALDRIEAVDADGRRQEGASRPTARRSCSTSTGRGPRVRDRRRRRTGRACSTSVAGATDGAHLAWTPRRSCASARAGSTPTSILAAGAVRSTATTPLGRARRRADELPLLSLRRRAGRSGKCGRVQRASRRQIRRGSSEDELGHELERLGLGGADDHRGDAALLPRLEPVGDALPRAEERDLVDQLVGHRRDRLAPSCRRGRGPGSPSPRPRSRSGTRGRCRSSCPRAPMPPM